MWWGQFAVVQLQIHKLWPFRIPQTQTGPVSSSRDTIRTQKRATPTPIGGTVRDSVGGYGTVWGDLGAFEGGTGWYGTGFPRKFLNQPVASTSLFCESLRNFAIFISGFAIFVPETYPGSPQGRFYLSICRTLPQSEQRVGHCNVRNPPLLSKQCETRCRSHVPGDVLASCIMYM